MRPPYPYGIQQAGGVRKIRWTSILRTLEPGEMNGLAIAIICYGQVAKSLLLAARYRLPSRWEWC